MTKGMDERIDNILQWFGHIERMGNNKSIQRVHVGERMGIRSVCRPKKRWINSLRECLKRMVMIVINGGFL